MAIADQERRVAKLNLAAESRRRAFGQCDVDGDVGEKVVYEFGLGGALKAEVLQVVH